MLASSAVAASPVFAKTTRARDSRDPRPNVMLIIMDDLRADMLGAYGNSFVSTPNIDTLARGGMRFDRAYCPFPQCSPARSSLMTGLRPSKTGMGIQGDARILGPRTVERLDYSLPTLGKLFRQSGYATSYVGKAHLSEADTAEDLRRYGFDTYVPVPEGDCLHVINRQSCSREQPFRWQSQSNLYFGRGVAGTRDRSALWDGRMADDAIDLIARQAERKSPFLMVYSDPRPHAPYFVPERELARYAPSDVALWENRHDTLAEKPVTQRRLRDTIVGPSQPSDDYWRDLIRHYASMVSAADADIGRVLDALDHAGLRQDTIVVFVADNGDLIGSHGFFSKGALGYEELLRVPMIVSWPARVPAGAHSRELVDLMDVVPTLVAAAGLAAPVDQFDGRSMLPLLAGDSAADWRDHHHVMHHGNAYGLCTMDVLINADYKYVHYAYDYGELYDRRNDPHEMRNLYHRDESRPILREMHRVLKQSIESNPGRIYVMNDRP